MEGYDYHPSPTTQLRIVLAKIDREYFEASVRSSRTSYKLSVCAAGIYVVVTWVYLYFQQFIAGAIWGAFSLVISWLAYSEERRLKHYQKSLDETDRTIANIKDEIPRAYQSLYIW